MLANLKIRRCIYCGKKVGSLKNKHIECEKKYLEGKNQIVDIIRDSILFGSDYKEIDDLITIIAKENYIKNEKLNESILIGWDNAIRKFIDDGNFSSDVDTNIAKFNTHFNFSKDELDKNNSYQKIIQLFLLRDVINGNLFNYSEGNEKLTFKLNDEEVLVYVFKNVKLFEKDSKTMEENGFSHHRLKISNGIYYKPQAFKENPIQTQKLIHLSDGMVGLSNKYIHFMGTNENFKIKYDQIASFIPFNDGVGILEYDSTANPKIFRIKNGWFGYNLIINLAQSM
jgi:hypothetical protein